MAKDIVAWTTGTRSTKLKDDLLEKVKEVRVAGFDYELRTEPRLVDRFDRMGQTDFYNETVTLDDGLSESNLCSTLIHEIIEIMHRFYRLNLDHETILRMEAAWYSVFSDNPALVEVINDHIKRRQAYPERDAVNEVIEAVKDSDSKEKPKKGEKEPKADRISLIG